MKSLLKTCMCLFVITSLISLTDSCKGKPVVILKTADVTGITQTIAVSGGNITAGNSVTITEKGVCWATKTDPSIAENKTSDGSGAGSFTSTMTGLLPGTDYYVRAYAINEKDTVYGNIIAISSVDFETLTDVDGNFYRNIQIGTQTWMSENLRTTRLNDGTVIPIVKNELMWAGLSTPAFCWYKNEEEAFKQTYGALYNWYAVNTGKLCPSGWHAPGDEEWSLLTTYLGGEKVAGGKLKETGSTYWVDPNAAATNEYGFTAFPGGFRYYDGKFFDFGFSSYWWSSREYSAERAWFRFVYYNDGNVYRFNNIKKNGFSVRCLKD